MWSNGVKIRRNTFKSKSRNDLAEQVSARDSYFFNRITPTWNALPVKIVQALTLNMFKKFLSAIARYIKLQSSGVLERRGKNY